MKCACPIWCDGEINGQRIRKSLGTRDWGRAGRLVAKTEDAATAGRVRKTVGDASGLFLGQCEVAESSLRKYKRVMREVKDFADTARLSHVDDFDPEAMDRFRQARRVSALTWSKELQIVRQFFSFCLDRKWTDDNPARRLKMPPEPKPRERAPYTPDELGKIIAACETFGRHPYERIRARAMVLLLRFYAPRISDVALLERSKIRLAGPYGDAIHFHAQKNGVPVWLPLYPEVRFALECLPPPRGAAADCRYFFWHGSGSRESYIKTVSRTLEAVFRESGVEKALIHRFRHTLATEILVKGGTIEDAANILGDSPDTIRRHLCEVEHGLPGQNRGCDAPNPRYTCGTRESHCSKPFIFSLVGGICG